MGSGCLKVGSPKPLQVDKNLSEDWRAEKVCTEKFALRKNVRQLLCHITTVIALHGFSAFSTGQAVAFRSLIFDLGFTATSSAAIPSCPDARLGIDWAKQPLHLSML